MVRISFCRAITAATLITAMAAGSTALGQGCLSRLFGFGDQPTTYSAEYTAYMPVTTTSYQPVNTTALRPVSIVAYQPVRRQAWRPFWRRSTPVTTLYAPTSTLYTAYSPVAVETSRPGLLGRLRSVFRRPTTTITFMPVAAAPAYPSVYDSASVSYDAPLSDGFEDACGVCGPSAASVPPSLPATSAAPTPAGPPSTYEQSQPDVDVRMRPPTEGENGSNGNGTEAKETSQPASGPQFRQAAFEQPIPYGVSPDVYEPPVVPLRRSGDSP